MAKQDIKIEPIVINGLKGRMLSIADRHSDNQILLIYGIHSSLERMQTTAEFMSDYGSVIMPDLPGIGGMNSFYEISKKPTLDNYADYLYTLIKLLKPKRKMVVVGMSFGFLVVTRMLQRYPDSALHFRHVISFVGFGKASDFSAYSSPWYTRLSRLLATRLGGWITKHLIFNEFSLRLMFTIFKLFNPKYKHAMRNNRQESLSMELDLWQKNDARTRFAIYVLLFSFDLTRHMPKINLPLHDMATSNDQYFHHDRVSKSLKKLYKTVTSSHANMALHAPSIIGTKQEVSDIFTDDVKKLLRSSRLY